jgi:hypothetical protein
LVEKKEANLFGNKEGIKNIGKDTSRNNYVSHSDMKQETKNIGIQNNSIHTNGAIELSTGEEVRIETPFLKNNKAPCVDRIAAGIALQKIRLRNFVKQCGREKRYLKTGQSL